MRTLTWHLPVVAVGSSQRETYRLDGAYNPVRAWVHAEVVPTVQDLLLDINVDGVSIFTIRLALRDEKDADTADFASVQLSRDSLVSLDVDQVGGEAIDVTVGLDLEEA